MSKAQHLFIRDKATGDFILEGRYPDHASACVAGREIAGYGNFYCQSIYNKPLPQSPARGLSKKLQSILESI